MIGPHDPPKGIWGTDLGFTARARDASELTVLFGDAWTSPAPGCQYPEVENNDLQASLPARRPAAFRAGPPKTPTGARAPSCGLLEFPHEHADDVTSWPRIRLFPGVAAQRPRDSINMGGLRTPLAAFSDGTRMLALFSRFDPAQCDETSDCPSGMLCSSAPDYQGKRIGHCSRFLKLLPDPPPDYCVDDRDCFDGTHCETAARGVCVATEPFTMSGSSPSWYRDDPKRGIANVLYVGAAVWPDRPADYAVLARFTTNRFRNATMRTVAYFDPERPEAADYRPGYHTLFMWGRDRFSATGGAQALPFFAYVPLDELRVPADQVVWRPRFFAGYGADGKPVWSEREADAQPIYGAGPQDVHETDNALEWTEPELDDVGQMSLSWIEPLQRWVMLYGGDLPAFMRIEPRSRKTAPIVNAPWAAGAIHMRSAAHPWGAARSAPEQPGWSSAEPVLTRELAAPYLRCPKSDRYTLPGCEKDPGESRGLALLGALAHAAVAPDVHFFDVAGSCIGGLAVRAVQDDLSGDPIGRMYAPSIIDDWTEDLTTEGDRRQDVGRAEIYWNVSMWNPYQVILFKTQLSAPRDPRASRAASAILVRSD